MSIYVDTSENFHPYECNGPGKCRHCDRQKIADVPGPYQHDPATCALCDPDYDGQPNEHRSIAEPRP